MATETVSKTKEAATPKRKTITNWKVLTDGNFVPVKVKCDGYKGHHPAELSCHTAFVPTGENVLRHMASDHGLGTFKIKFRISDGKPHKLWEELEQSGVEIQDLYCPHCRQEVPLVPRQLVNHLNQHAGANRINLEPQTLCFTLGFDRPDALETESLYEVEN